MFSLVQPLQTVEVVTSDVQECLVVGGARTARLSQKLVMMSVVNPHFKRKQPPAQKQHQFRKPFHLTSI